MFLYIYVYINYLPVHGFLLLEPEFVNVYGAQESIPPGYIGWPGGIDSLDIYKFGL
jgi:hypothetical protein